MTTEAINVFPRPVGKQTKVLWNRADSQISRWYVRTGKLVGYIHVPVIEMKWIHECGCDYKTRTYNIPISSVSGSRLWEVVVWWYSPWSEELGVVSRPFSSKKYERTTFEEVPFFWRRVWKFMCSVPTCLTTCVPHIWITIEGIYQIFHLSISFLLCFVHRGVGTMAFV